MQRVARGLSLLWSVQSHNRIRLCPDLLALCQNNDRTLKPSDRMRALSTPLLFPVDKAPTRDLWIAFF